LNGTRETITRNPAASIAHTTKHVIQMLIGCRIDRAVAQRDASSRADRIASRAQLDSLVSDPVTRSRARIRSTRTFALANHPAPSMHARGPATGPAARDALDALDAVNTLPRGERGTRVAPVRRSPISRSNAPGIGLRASARVRVSDAVDRPSPSNARARRVPFAAGAESFDGAHGLTRQAPLLRWPEQTPYSNATRQAEQISVAPSVLAYMARTPPVELQWRTLAKRRPDPRAAENDVAAVAKSMTRVQDSPSDPPLSAARSAGVSVTELAPGLVDRLAREVIRRMDRRAQIERERRGL
jgi:hypothetical protein